MLITTTQLIGSIGVVGLLQFLLARWIEARLISSIKHEYDKELENYRLSKIQQQKAEIIARFLSRWIKYRGQHIKLLNRKELIDHYEELNHMSFEISLWIRDERTLDEIMKLFRLEPGAPNVREVIGKVRKMLLDKPDDKFDHNQITLWPMDTEAKDLFGL